MNVTIHQTRGCGYHFLDSQTFNQSTDIACALSQILPALLHAPYFPFKGSPLLIEAGTGYGKTRAILSSVIPFACTNGLNVCFVSSRAAINTQFKRALAKQLGLKDLLENYTSQGLRQLLQIGPVRILTYHGLWQSILCSESWLRNVDIFIFDEIHALALDATFVPFTGALLQQIPQLFRRAARIYLTATPKPILDFLMLAEGNEVLRKFRWPADYSAFDLFFYSTQQDIINYLGSLPADEKALVFVSSIAQGEAIFKQIKAPCRLLTAKTKEREPEIWSTLLEHQTLDCQILLTTSTLDAGVSITDPNLRHIFCCGINAAAVLQQAGRKRLRTGERLRLYLWSPSRQQLGRLLAQNFAFQTAKKLYVSKPHQFLQDYVLGDALPLIRNTCLINRDRSITINPLASHYYAQEADLLQELLAQEDIWPMDNYWMKTFQQDQPLDPTQWLDGRHNTTRADELRAWLEAQIGLEITKEQADLWSEEFRHRYHLAYGRRKNERTDRSWKKTFIQRTLADLKWNLTIEATSNGFRIVQTN